jgi:hypothetical protein
VTGGDVASPEHDERVVVDLRELGRVDAGPCVRGREADVGGAEARKAQGLEHRGVRFLPGHHVHAWGAVQANRPARRGRTPILIIDEAHLLPATTSQLEAVRMLTNHDLDTPGSPFAALLVGQPEHAQDAPGHAGCQPCGDADDGAPGRR